MTNQFQIYSSNRVECLYQRLRDALFSKTSSPFARRMVIVPSPAMKSWLSLRLAEDPSCGISAGIEAGYPDQSIRSIVNMTGVVDTFDRINPSAMELSLLFETLLRNIMRNYSTLGKRQQAIWSPLLDYLSFFNDATSRKLDRRLTALCSKLSKQFGEYTVYDSLMLNEWTEGRGAGWQSELWKHLLEAYPKLIFPFQEMEEAITRINEGRANLKGRNLEVHLFSVSFLAAKHHHFLQQVAREVPVHYYMLSPCQVFWSDICSDKENTRLEAYWKKRGVSRSQQIALEDFLQERNPLLANFGKLGREMSKQVEEVDAKVVEDYILTQSICDHEQYESILIEDEVVLENSNKSLTLLQALQADMLLLRNPDPDNKIELDTQDRSFEIHVAPSRKREVEIIYDILLRIIQKHAQDSDPIAPNDIIVMAPEIMEYEAHIRSVFGSRESLLDYQIMDVSMPVQSELIRGFLHLLDMAFGRWEAESVVELFGFSSFLRRHGINQEEVNRIRGWIKDSGVRWGLSSDHRNELLSKDHSLRKLADSNSAGTWEHATTRLLMGLAYDVSSLEDEVIFDAKIAPLEGMETSTALVLGRWLYLLKSIQEDLKVFASSKEMTAADWAAYLKCILEAYFRPDSTDKSSMEIWDTLEAKIGSIGNAGRIAGKSTFPFSTIRSHLNAALNQESVSFRESHLHSVKFCSMLPMRALPSKVILVMGMHESAYPRRDFKLSINEMLQSKSADYNPSQTDFDRYIFLEAILSSRQYFIATYPGYSVEDNKEQPASLLVQELLSYADQGYCFAENIQPSKYLVVKHPFHAFDKTYFKPQSQIQSFSPSSFAFAKAYYDHLQRKAPHAFLKDFAVHLSGNSNVDDSEITLDVKELANFAKDPLKVYFNKTLGVYLKNSEDSKIKSTEDFEISNLHKAVLQKAALKKPIDLILKSAENEGLIPPGMFGEVAIENMKQAFETLQSNCKSMGVDIQNLGVLHFADHFEKPFFNERGIWELPSIRIPYQGKFHVKLIGKISNICSEGIVDMKEGKETQVLRQWPYYLAFHHAINLYGLPMKPQLLFAKDMAMKTPFCGDMHPHLEGFLDFYFVGLKNISPLIPEWIPSILKEEPDEFTDKIRKSCFDVHSNFYNDYALWLFKDEMSLPDASSVLQAWKPKAHALYDVMMDHWFPQKEPKKVKIYS